MARLERTEASLAEARSELNLERERTAVKLAEANARLERAETTLTEANERIETMRDPANETEVRRLRNEIANLQIAHTDREAELSAALAAGRKARERWADHAKAAVLKGEEDWRREEARRLEAAKREWERQARWAAEMNAPPEPIAEPSSAKRANRLLLEPICNINSVPNHHGTKAFRTVNGAAQDAAVLQADGNRDCPAAGINVFDA